MNCIYCERPANGTCIFCGRGVCKDHFKTMPNVIAFYRGKSNKLKAIITENALYCGICKPKEDPIELGEIDD